MVNTRHKGTSNQGASRPSSEPPSTSSTPSNSWVLITKGNRGKQRHVPLTPTIVQPSAAISSSAQALSSDTQPSAVELVRPFILGIERASVLIDITNIKDIGLLEEGLKKCNSAAHHPDQPTDFIGYPETVRSYLGHRFMETMWVPNSSGRKTILDDGVFLSDGTFIKGFESYPSDARIVHVKLENLPYLPGQLVMQDMKRVMSFYGEVLDVGITQINGLFHGKGYVTLNLKRERIPTNVCLSMDHSHGMEDSTCDGYLKFADLTRVIPWEEEDGHYRHVLAQWDSMPEFCRICQKSGHCRADCPEYRKHVVCHHCNQHGHIARNCPRHDEEANKVRVVERPTDRNTASTTRSGKGKGKGRETSTTSTGARRRLEQAAAPPKDADTKMAESTLPPPPPDSQGLEQALGRSTDDAEMLDAPPQTDPHDPNSSNGNQAIPPTDMNKTIPPGSPLGATGDAPPALNNEQPSNRQTSFDENSHLVKGAKTTLKGDISDTRRLNAEGKRQDMDARAQDLHKKISEASNSSPNRL